MRLLRSNQTYSYVIFVPLLCHIEIENDRKQRNLVEYKITLTCWFFREKLDVKLSYALKPSLKILSENIIRKRDCYQI